ncbi:MAG TPA: glycosyltransferase [Verrucomicrobiae bacterium]|nr:glycosyltransferase [Verrucomicrobiae bacterium]
MLKNRIYYRVKPYLPWRFRMGLRRLFARLTLRAYQDVWPINRAASPPPRNWPGWPDGKKFAVVLTHDVEGARGISQARQLAALEKKLGFRSSFNFVPEGEASVPADLRAELIRDGFEVGVHDLHHDGKLFWDRAEFIRRAQRINSYLKEWGCSGFRSAFMQHNLDWIHDLEIRYDASTFDTDPFEPQPDGVTTIFPFWKPGMGGRGYMELPYTLPQDSTLFLLLKESSPEIWKRKLDWIVECGGMALVNVHPDYINFDPARRTNRSFPCAYYQEFLEYIQDRYPNLYWHALPRDVAKFCEAVRPEVRIASGRNVCMLTHSVYESDNRVMRYAEALADRGDEVDVLCVKRDRNQPDTEIINRVRVRRVLRRSGKRAKGQTAYLVPLLRFWFNSMVTLTWENLKRRYDLIHVHNVPDFLVFAAWCPKLTGAAVILDIHDIVPEFYGSKFGKHGEGMGVRLLKWMERLSAGYADHVIIANHLWLDKYAKRTGANGKCSVLINYVDTRVFRPRAPSPHDSRPIIMFPGGLQWHQGLDIAIRAMPRITERIPQAELHIYGDGNMKDSLVTLTHELGLNGQVRFFDPLPVRQIADIMATADVGVVPKRADSFGNEAYSTKIMEFMSLHVPVVVSKTRIDQYYFDDAGVRFFESGDSDALAEAVCEVLSNPALRQRMVARASEYAARNDWTNAKVGYLKLVDGLCARNQRP